MSFRARLMLLTAVAIAVTVSTTSVAVWAVAKHELLSQVDASLALGSSPYSRLLTLVVGADGSSIGNQNIPVTRQIVAVAAGRHGPFFTTTTVQGVHIREFVAPRAPGEAIVRVQDLSPTDHALARIKRWILLIGGAGILLAAALAAFVAAAALRPVRRLTAAAESVAATGDLAERVRQTGDDELGRLAVRFNEMLAALEESVGRQRRLVADASHELRTPLTAARANVDLVREGQLGDDETRRALDEASAELESLTALVADLVELARGAERKLHVEEVQLDDLVAAAVDRARTRAPETTFVTALSPTVVSADPVLLDRAVSNLLDNAVKYSPQGAPIEVSVREGEVVVADHGPGVAEEDLPRIFDRFYRAAAARAKPGAGLGLAIVREAAEAHGGTATVESSARGARFRLTLPASAPA
ncbi:MAG TPA: HAMP domain-containing sensor histidine kinase [Gaiellaceae bacterium]|nr:HAMP domain-containing sensor histidine kinase [Gaiellaceae bacterium]